MVNHLALNLNLKTRTRAPKPNVNRRENENEKGRPFQAASAFQLIPSTPSFHSAQRPLSQHLSSLQSDSTAAPLPALRRSSSRSACRRLPTVPESGPLRR